MQNLSSSRKYQYYKARKHFNQISWKILRYTMYVFSLIILFLVVISFFKLINVSDHFIGLSYIFIGTTLIMIIIDFFINYGLVVRTKKDLKDAQDDEIMDYLSEDVLEIFDEYIKLLKKYKIRTMNFGMFIFALKNTLKGKYFLVRTGLVLSKNVEENFAQKITGSIQGMEAAIINLNNFLKLLKEEAVERKNNEIGFTEFVLGLYENNTFVMHIFSEMDLKKDDLSSILSWENRAFIESKRKYFWQKDYYIEGIGRNWASGYTPVLNMYSTDISEYLGNISLEYQGRSRIELLKSMEDVLAKSGKNNLLLVGDPGVGKKTLVNALAQKIIRGRSYQDLCYKHIVQLDIGKILAGASSKGEVEARFDRILYEAQRAGNIILYIDNLAMLIGGGNETLGKVDASEYLYPYLESERLQVIASLTYEDYKNRLQANTSLESLFSKITVDPLDKKDVMPSIEHVIAYIEKKHKIVFSYQAVKNIIELSDRYIHGEPFPQKAVDLLAEVAIRNEKSGKILVVSEDVEEVVKEKVKVPVGKVENIEKEKLLNLEGILHEKIIGQDEAISAIANSLRRSRAGLGRKNKPIGTFLFIGPTGVGKTETAKTLASNYYGSESNMIRFDMSEFQQISSIAELIGNKVGQEFLPGRLTQSVNNNPYSLVLLDEIEKAHPNILNLFLQILDEGKITDAAGRAIDFTNTIIIATSNAGSEQIRQLLKKNMSGDELGKVIIDYLLKQGVFKPEFINRFDKVVCYKPLNHEEILEVIKLMIQRVGKTLEEKEMKLEINDKAIEKLASEGYDPVFGARPLQRIIQEKVENMIATKILSGELQKGQTITITEKEV